MGEYCWCHWRWSLPDARAPRTPARCPPRPPRPPSRRPPRQHPPPNRRPPPSTPTPNSPLPNRPTSTPSTPTSPPPATRPTPTFAAEIERLYTGPNLEFTIDQLDALVEQNWVAQPNSDEPSRSLILLSPQPVPDRPELVELVACEIDSQVFVEVGGAPDGSDELVDDQIVIRRILVRMEAVEGKWKSRSGEVLGEVGTAEDCVNR